MAVSPNTVLGKYRILREIARSNDIVYEAVDPAMGRRVALKELQLPPHLAGSQRRERVERFYREAKAAGTLSHPNIVTIHEVGQEGDRHFIAMEYLEGQSLRDILQMQGALPLKETLEIALQMCDALSYAHSRGVVHRDIKPDNIHILPGGIIKLTDFGIARITAEPSITSQGQVFGTPSYMSPEQIASHTVDHRTDLFSLGVTLYEMLTGRKPFTGDSVITITYNIMNTQPAMPIGVPPALHGVLQRALAKDPGLRYQSAAQMAADLRAEKFALESPQADMVRPVTSMTFGGPPVNGYPATLNTGTVPPEISGQPVAGAYAPGGGYGAPGVPSQMPGVTGGQYGTGYEPYQAGSGGLSPQARSFLGLLFSVLGLGLLITLIVWGVSTAYHASQVQNQRAAASRAYVRAAQAYNSGDYTSAAQGFEEARRLAPPNTEEAQRATQGLSTVAATRGQRVAASDPAAAQMAYQQAIALNAKNAAAYDNLGHLHWQQRDWQAALNDWESAVQADPASAAAADARQNATLAYQDLAERAYSSGNVAQARNFWQKITEINPGSDAANQALQRINTTQGAGGDGSGPNNGF